MMKSINRRSLLYFALAVAAALALYGLSARLAAEGGGKTAAFVTDSREIFSLAYQSGKTPADVWREVNALGVAGAAVSEFTGRMARGKRARRRRSRGLRVHRRRARYVFQPRRAFRLRRLVYREA